MVSDSARAQRAEEVEALSAILGMEFQELDSDQWVVHLPTVKRAKSSRSNINSESEDGAKLILHLPPGYPETEPPVPLTDEIPNDIPFEPESFFKSLEWTPGESCVYDWVCELRGHLEDLQNLMREDGDDLDDDVLEIDKEHLIASYYDSVDDKDYEKIGSKNVKAAPVKFHHADPFTEKKSTFQGHVCHVETQADVTRALEYLYQDNRIRRATHNQYAWRIVESGGIVRADNDDDGESGAGKKLAELLNFKAAENCLCVVSRWYGGVQMGPDRFKCIAKAGLQSLEMAGKIGKKK